VGATRSALLSLVDEHLGNSTESQPFLPQILVSQQSLKNLDSVNMETSATSGNSCGHVECILADHCTVLPKIDGHKHQPEHLMIADIKKNIKQVQTELKRREIPTDKKILDRHHGLKVNKSKRVKWHPKVRVWSAEKRKKNGQKAAICIQSMVRKAQAQEKAKRRLSSLIRIQNHVRYRRATTDFTSCKGAEASATEVFDKDSKCCKEISGYPAITEAPKGYNHFPGSSEEEAGSSKGTTAPSTEVERESRSSSFDHPERSAPISGYTASSEAPQRYSRCPGSSEEETGSS